VALYGYPDAIANLIRRTLTVRTTPILNSAFGAAGFHVPHDTRDVTFCEDASCICRTPGIFARLRGFAYDVLCFNQSDTMAQDGYAASKL
jgi:hypothetical protein